jgi:type IV secretory pathway TrbD component
MKCNVGKTDRMLRITAGLMLIVGGLATQNWFIAVIGFVPLLTGIMRWCPAYVPLGISTEKKD